MGWGWHNAKAWCALAQSNARAHALSVEPCCRGSHWFFSILLGWGNREQRATSRPNGNVARHPLPQHDVVDQAGGAHTGRHDHDGAGVGPSDRPELLVHEGQILRAHLRSLQDLHPAPREMEVLK